MRGFKVVTYDTANDATAEQTMFYSAAPFGDQSIQYMMNETTVPNGSNGPLAVFHDLAHAQGYVKHGSVRWFPKVARNEDNFHPRVGYAIFEVEYEPYDGGGQFPIVHDFCPNKLKGLWCFGRQPKNPESLTFDEFVDRVKMYDDCLPCGTVLASSVTLIKLVEIKHETQNTGQESAGSAAPGTRSPRWHRGTQGRRD